MAQNMNLKTFLLRVHHSVYPNVVQYTLISRTTQKVRMYKMSK